MHCGTFPLLTGTPDRLKQLVAPTSDRRAGAEAGGNRVLIRDPLSVVRSPQSARGAAVEDAAYATLSRLVQTPSEPRWFD